MNDQTISGQAETLRLTADAVPLTDANALCDAIETLRDQLAEILGTDNEIVSQAHHLAEAAANIVRTLANLRNKIQEASEPHRAPSATLPPPALPAPTPQPQAPTSTYDSLPKPVVTAPKPLPAGVTDDPTTWPGSIEDNGVSGEEIFSPDEFSIAKRLAQTGDTVRRLPPQDNGRTADAAVNGEVVEFKTLQQKDGQVPTRKTVKKMIRKSQSGEGQSPDVIIDARKTDLSAENAASGLKAYLNAPENSNKLTRIRVWGRIFDFDWRREL
ncbi:hypothetical protein [Saccharopolyspora shandongensis]|uniref:CdiA C-terminal domain-containing protein n=1 Tax=Saccharopolyspora shandongensis TaxID=418495 RepID=UPI0033EB317A